MAQDKAEQVTPPFPHREDYGGAKKAVLRRGRQQMAVPLDPLRWPISPPFGMVQEVQVLDRPPTPWGRNEDIAHEGPRHHTEHHLYLIREWRGGEVALYDFERVVEVNP